MGGGSDPGPLRGRSRERAFFSFGIRIVTSERGSISGRTPERTEIRDSNRQPSTKIRSSVIHSSRRQTRPRCPSADDGRRKRDVCLDGTLFSPHKDGHPDARDDRDGPRGRRAEGNKPTGKGQMLREATYLPNLQ